MIEIGQEELAQFKSEVERRYGLYFDERRRDGFLEVLRTRMREVKESSAARYLGRIANDDTEWGLIVGRITVSETYFFRIEDHFRALRETVIPQRLQARSDLRRLRIVSLGCASGEEPHSIAMILREERTRLAGWDVQITGIDVNEAVLEKARQAQYTEWSLRVTSDYFKQRYFTRKGRQLYQLNDDIRSAVRFECRNLAALDPDPWRDSIDIIFFRNVFMYFTAEATRRIISTVAAMLAPGGYLFLSPAETLRGITQDFTLCHTHDSFYYQKRDSGAVPAEAANSAAALDQNDGSGKPWHDQVRASAERISLLAEASLPSATVSDSGTPAMSRNWNVAPILEMLGSDRPREALSAIQALPAQAAADPDVLLLQAVLYTNAGQVAEAEQACRRLLAHDDLNAGAHYLLALCREQSKDRAGALQENDAATYLDPSFAMPYVHRGILARRSGQVESAQRELHQALALLAREDAARILLFGGGFNRDTLKQLCERELRACGSNP